MSEDHAENDSPSPEAEASEPVAPEVAASEVAPDGEPTTGLRAKPPSRAKRRARADF